MFVVRNVYCDKINQMKRKMFRLKIISKYIYIKLQPILVYFRGNKEILLILFSIGKTQSGALSTISDCILK